MKRNVTIWLGVLSAAACAMQAPAPTAPPKPLKRGSIAYYTDHCARCHGVYGAGYPDEFTKGKTPQEMKDVVMSMAANQGGSELSAPAELEAQVAFHYAIDRNKPFLTWTRADGNELSGEVTPGATVEARVGPKDLGAEYMKGMWKVKLPHGVEASQVVVTAIATADKARSSMDLSKAPYSPVGSGKT